MPSNENRKLKTCRVFVTTGLLALGIALGGCRTMAKPMATPAGTPAAHASAAQKLSAHPAALRVRPLKTAPIHHRVAAGSLPVPGTSLSIGAHWGTMPARNVAMHRPWSTMHAVYLTAPVRHNPVYMHDVDSSANFYDHRASWKPAAMSLLNIPWFYVNLAITPALMVVHPPLQRVKSPVAVRQPVYNGALPCGGPLVPAPLVGRIYWRYPRVRPLTTVQPH